MEKSSYYVTVSNAPVLRFDYERSKERHPVAHLQFSGTGTWLSPALMKNRHNEKARKGQLDALHIPVGGHRFRPSLEDFLYFLIRECGFAGVDGWEEKLSTSREGWLGVQLSAAVRDDPTGAARVLESMGCQVIPPRGGYPHVKRRSGW